MEDYHGQTPNSSGFLDEWEEGVFEEDSLRRAFTRMVSKTPEGPERERAVDTLKAHAYLGDLDPARVQEIYEEVLLEAEQLRLPSTEEEASIRRLAANMRLSRTEAQGFRTPLRQQEEAKQQREGDI